MRTEKLLLIGMALTADRKTLENRVKGVFAKKRTGVLVRISLLLLCLCLGLMCFTSACQPKQLDVLVQKGGDQMPAVSPEASPTDAASATDADKKLSIYVWDSLKQRSPGVAIEMLKSIKEKYPDYEITFYDPSGGDFTMSPDDCMTRLNSDLIAGKGPDILIGWAAMFHYFTQNNDGSEVTIDVADLGKQILSGAYVDMAPYVENDPDFSNDAVYSKVIDGAKVNGKLCSIPLTFSYIGATTCGDTLAAAGIDITPSDSLDVLLGKLEKYLNAEEDRQVFSCVELTSKAFLEAVVSQMCDYTTKEVKLDADLIKRILEFDRFELANPGQEYQIGVPDQGVSEHVAGKYIFNYTYYNINANMSYATALEACGGARFIPFRNMDDGVSVNVQLCGLINIGTKDPELAYDCLKLAMKTMLSNKACTWFGIPILRECACENISAHSGIANTSINEAFNINNQAIPMPQQYYDDYLALADEVTSVSLSNGFMLKFDAFTPYVNGEKTFEECYDEAEYNLMLFLSE